MSGMELIKSSMYTPTKEEVELLINICKDKGQYQWHMNKESRYYLLFEESDKNSLYYCPEKNDLCVVEYFHEYGYRMYPAFHEHSYWKICVDRYINNKPNITGIRYKNMIFD